MTEVLTRAMCFVAIIVMGMILRRVGFFKHEDFYLLSRIAVRITLPAAVITSFAGKEFDFTLLSLGLLGLGGGLVYMLVGWLLGRGREGKAFGLLNTAGYNIGNFTMPFVQSFLGPSGVIITSLFDTGNACVCLGGAYAVASLVKDGKGFDLGRLLKTMATSTTFMTYLLVVILAVLGLRLPGPVEDLAAIIGAANPFLAMLMIGVGFRLEADREQLAQVARILIPRYALASVFAFLAWNFLPFDQTVRTAVTILVFSPIGSAAPAYTGELELDAGLAAAVNSISILISIPIIVTLLLVLL